MEHYSVTGMSCAACSSRVEKAVSKVDGVTECTVSLLTNSMTVEGTAAPETIIQAVKDAGYGATQKDKAAGKQSRSQEDEMSEIEDKEIKTLRNRLCSSVVFLLLLMYLSMGHMMWGWPLPGFLKDNHVAMGLIQMLLTIVIMVINQKFFVSGFKSLLHRSPNMDTLVALGSGAAFGYSTYALFAMTDAQMKNDMHTVMGYMHEFYFESAAMILTLITVGKMLEAYSKGKTTNAIKSLLQLAPKKASVLRNGEYVEVSIEEVRVDDLFLVHPGESIPVDGIVVEGNSAVNEASLTGESIPVDKTKGDTVSAATVNQSGVLTCKAVRIGEDTTLSQIIHMVSDAAATKAPIAKVADKVSGVFVPAVLLIAAVTTIIWLLAGQDVGFALARGISVLVISCPCALGLATPVAIMVGNGVGAKNGIMFKNASALEEAGRIRRIALDKTGTITKGEPEVTDIVAAEDVTKDELLLYAYALEKNSEHPLAKAIHMYAQKKKIEAKEVDELEALAGHGLQAKINGKGLYGGNRGFVEEKVAVANEILQKGEQFAKEGKTPLYFAMDQKMLGLIAVADVLKEEAAQAVQELQDLGIHVTMLTGDHEETAKAIGRLAGVDEVIAGVLPDGKESTIRTLQQRGKVAMVGDGINDAPALTRADVGVAIGAGTDIAIDAADVVLMKSNVRDIPAMIRLSRATLRNIHENLFWAFIYNVIGIPLAAGAWISLFHWELNPMFGAAAMSLSSFCVVSNALRLNLCKIYDAKKKHNHKMVEPVIENKASSQEPLAEQSLNKIKKEEDKKMEKEMKIEGMMCGHCEARVKKALEAVDGVKEAIVSHEKKNAIVTLEKEVANDVLKEAVEAQDYEVTSIQ
ncbi:MAG: heavy metal translocating P-type ATPase [Lachnospiraceae bacterium]|nr:heavy metal translocating P-type ATPase [Lachnospiraceae bacterium]